MRGTSLLSLPLLLAAVACGRYVQVDGDPGSASPTAMAGLDGGTSTGTLDASVATTPPAGRCNPEGTFGALSPVTLPVLDGSIATFRATGGGTGVLALGDDDNEHELRTFQLVGDRITNVVSLGPPYDQGELGQVALSADARTLVVTEAKGTNDSDLFFAHRAELDQPFPAPQKTTHPGLDDALHAPFLVGNRIYFSRAPKRSNEVILVADFDPVSGALANAVEVLPTGLALGARLLPVVTPDELEIFFAYGLTGSNAQIMHATRPTVNAPFATPGFLFLTPPTGSVGFDYPTWVSEDGCSLWAISKRNGSPSVLMRATRQ